jgi:hypothetical protein
VGTGITSDPLRTGDLVIIANGGNRNAAASTAGSGGVIAGNSSRAIIRDTSTATAAIGGGTIHAGSIMVDARQATQYAPTADSYNASLVGGGGAYAANTATTAAATTIGDRTQLLANSLVRLASDNRYQQSQAEFSTRGGAGGAGGCSANGAAGGAAHHEALHPHVGTGPDQVADPLETEHRVVDIKRQHRQTMHCVAGRGGCP